MAANWKVILENYNECYHCGPVHPELCELVPAFRRGGGDLDWDAGIPHRPGATTFTLDRDHAPGAVSRPVRGGADPALRRAGAAQPHAQPVRRPRGRLHRCGRGPPGRPRSLCDFLFHPAELARPGFDPSDAAGFWDLVNRQDWTICEQVQDGMGSRRFSVGYLAPMEQPSADIGRYVARSYEENWRTRTDGWTAAGGGQPGSRRPGCRQGRRRPVGDWPADRDTG